jgi:hypothetical protein
MVLNHVMVSISHQLETTPSFLSLSIHYRVWLFVWKVFFITISIHREYWVSYVLYLYVLDILHGKQFLYSTKFFDDNLGFIIYIIFIGCDLKSVFGCIQS